MRAKRATTSKEDFFWWYNKNNELMRRYLTDVSLGMKLGNDNENAFAKKETEAKYMETMALFPALWN